MSPYRKWIKSLPLLIRIILALPVLDGIFYGIYRICQGKLSNVILGVLWFPFGAALGWIADIVCLALEKNLLEF